jgi:hypothetical protein
MKNAEFRTSLFGCSLFLLIYCYALWVVWEASFKPPIWGVGGLKLGDGKYKNNNGNSSLGLVPIHRSQPRLFTMPDYCYSDRLLHKAETFFRNPLLSGLACYSRTFRLSFPMPRHGSGTKCHSGAGTYFPKDIASVSDNPGPKPVVFCTL